jgi:hypothetical protein
MGLVDWNNGGRVLEHGVLQEKVRAPTALFGVWSVADNMKLQQCRDYCSVTFKPCLETIPLYGRFNCLVSMVFVMMQPHVYSISQLRAKLNNCALLTSSLPPSARCIMPTG